MIKTESTRKSAFFMTDENKVRIIVNGEAAEYEHWTDVSITSEPFVDGQDHSKTDFEAGDMGGCRNNRA